MEYELAMEQDNTGMKACIHTITQYAHIIKKNIYRFILLNICEIIGGGGGGIGSFVNILL